MEFVGYLAPIAFVFAISAISQIGALRKELQQLRAQVAALSTRLDNSDRS